MATRDQLNTTAGSLALLGSVVRRDAGVVARLRRAGAVVIGKANMDEWANFRSAIGTAIVVENFGIANLDVIQNATVSGELAVLAAEFKISLNAYLSDLSYSPVQSLAEIIAFNNAHPDEEMLQRFGQLIFLVSQNTTGIGSVEQAAIQKLDDLTTNGVEKVMKEHRLDAIVAPDSSFATVLAIAALPGIAVPAGYDEEGAPFGITFGGLKGYEPRLIEIAYGFEQATKVRKPPMFKQ
nr:unnamed protein product [Digitaria exilis]